MRKYRGVECMAKKKKAKTHQNIDGRLLQMNKRFSNLKQKQQQSINDWLYEEYRRIYAKIGMPPDSSYNSNILLAVDSKMSLTSLFWVYAEVSSFLTPYLEGRCIKTYLHSYLQIWSIIKNRHMISRYTRLQYITIHRFTNC